MESTLISELKKAATDIELSATKEIEQATLKTLERTKSKYVGKKGEITALMSRIRELSTEGKREFGPVVNNLKEKIERAVELRRERLLSEAAAAKQLKQKSFDVTAYKPKAKIGHMHPYSRFIERIENIFLTMGYEIVEGPLVEVEYYNFTALNIPKDHPARDMHDTFWLEKDGYLLRTQTSNVQVRVMQEKDPPIAVVSPGITFRHEAVDASHDFQFMQCEGFLIDKKVTVADLFGTAKRFLAELFGHQNIEIRIRPGFFPFVEPGFEIDVRCPFCKHGCSVCKKSKWIEIFPGGLIHPNVLRAGGLNPDEYSGFAFGFGLTRLVMLWHGINDIRLLNSGKIRFLEQF